LWFPENLPIDPRCCCQSSDTFCQERSHFSCFGLKIPLITYKALRGQASVWGTMRSFTFHPIRSLCSQHEGLLVVPRTVRSRLGGRAFSVQAPLLWNQLPPSNKATITLSASRIKLKLVLKHLKLILKQLKLV